MLRSNSCAVNKIELFILFVRRILILSYVPKRGNSERRPKEKEATASDTPKEATVYLHHHGRNIVSSAEEVDSSSDGTGPIGSAALVPPSLSPWRKLYDEGDSLSFLHITGLTREAFDRLLYVVLPPGHSLWMQRRGRPWSLPPDGMLGLLLCYLGSQMTIKWLCLIFWHHPLTMLSYSQKNSSDDGEAFALSSVCEDKLPQ